MPPTTSHTEGGVEPLRPISELFHSLSLTAVHLVLGVALGVILARQMRARDLHWGCAAVAAAVMLLARASLEPWSLTLVTSATVGALRGRRWHIEDLEAGADLAASARHRARPQDLLALLGRAVAARLRGRCVPPRDLHSGPMSLGRDSRGRVVSIPVGDGGARHTLVVGATGSGKTVTQTAIALAAIQRGMGAVVLDPKGDEDMRDALRQGAEDAGRHFLEWTPQGAWVYNPYARGSETEIADKALAGERFTEPHYLRQAQRYLGHVVRGLRTTGTEVSLRAIVEHLEPQRLEMLVRAAGESRLSATYDYLDSLTPRQQSDLAGVRDRLAILAESDVGAWLDPQTPGADRFDLLEAIRARAVVCFSLESDRRPLIAQMLGSAIVQDLQTVVAAQQRSPVPTLIVIDEFSAVAAEQVVRLFGRARSAGISLLLGTQEVSDLRVPGRERLLEQVVGNLSLLIAHRQVVPSSAELIAGVAGTRGAWRLSRHSDGRTTRTRTREGVLDPSEVMHLDRGRCAVIALDRRSDVRITRVWAPGHSA